jgi:hypothetical protein
VAVEAGLGNQDSNFLLRHFLLRELCALSELSVILSALRYVS